MSVNWKSECCGSWALILEKEPSRNNVSCKCGVDSTAHRCVHLREPSIQATFTHYPTYNHHPNHDYNHPNNDYNNHNHDFHHPNHYGKDINTHNHRSLPVPCVICVFVGGAANSGAGGGGGDIPGDSGGGGGGGLPQATKTQISGITHGGPVSSPA
ncbi:protein doublesex-like [Eriocheir sinensis]|uniref:protein doublesex-like n=1 Tax=Eriocheir sinensis TaxID=95602 RepID=UPI0021C7D55E|nr:protein doublesex-like [Eriocheir sinensis]